jgi:hypothetical protein
MEFFQKLAKFVPRIKDQMFNGLPLMYQLTHFGYENMNILLDDYKKLCFSSKTVINFTDRIMLFEVEDLEKISTAAVFRCCIVYIQYLTSFR